jgi:membrane-associated phospholipid phosphatase
LRPGLPTLAVAGFLQSVAAFALLAMAYATGASVMHLDNEFANTLHANVVPPLTTVFAAVTMLGNTSVLALVAVAAAAFLLGRGRARDASLVVVTLVGAQLLTLFLKAIFERPRPSFDDPIATAGWFSFPSGHALSSIALYGALVFVFTDRLRSPRAHLAALGAGVLIAAIGFSRLYLGVHYLTDVLAGYSAGLAWLILAIGAFSVRTTRKPPQRGFSRSG